MRRARDPRRPARPCRAPARVLAMGVVSRAANELEPCRRRSSVYWRRSVPIMTDMPLTIMMVQLCQGSLKTHRVLHGANPDLYPVFVYFSRHVDEYERRELTDFGIIREEDDGMCALIENTTLEQIRDQLDKYNAALASAVARARETRAAAEAVRAAAEAEDERLKALVNAINTTLRDARHD